MVGRAARLVFDQVKSSKLPDLAIYWSEYNAGFDPHLWQLDSAYVGPWLAQTISLCDGLVTELVYWTFTDCGFEELGLLKGVFGTGFGLIAAGGIAKAPFNVFKILHLLGDQRIRDIGCDAALATIRSDGTIVAAVWNYVAPDQSGGGDSKTFRISLEGTECRLACVHVVDADHGNPLKAWEAMGRPAYPSLAQQRELRLAGELSAAQVVELKHKKELTVTVAPHGLVVIELIK
jgi:xylan 1,4-beta-xylosidase